MNVQKDRVDYSPLLLLLSIPFPISPIVTGALAIPATMLPRSTPLMSLEVQVGTKNVTKNNEKDMNMLRSPSWNILE